MAYILNGDPIAGFPSKAKDIDYDNTSSGLSATDVNGAIDEVNARSALNDFNSSSEVDISSYTSSDYTCPTDGYVSVSNNSGNTGYVMIKGATYNTDYTTLGGNQGRFTTYVKKGMRLRVANSPNYATYLKLV